MTGTFRSSQVAGSQENERSPFARLTELLAPYQPGKPLITLSLGEPQHGREESVYKTLGRLYRGMALDALGQRDEAVRFYKMVRSAKGPDSARDIAKNLLKAPYPG